MTDPSALPADEAPEYPSPDILDSRRLTGANLFDRAPGAVLEVRPSAFSEERLEKWRVSVNLLSGLLSWPDCRKHTLTREHSVQLFITAPLNGLMTATSLNELAWVMAESPSDARTAEAHELLVQALHSLWAEESVRLQSATDLASEAASRDVNVCLDDESLSVGSGAGAMLWPLESVPHARDVNWRAVSDVSTTLVTGSNGKTTTVRLIAAMWREAGVAVGWSCSDGVFVATDTVAAIEQGDYTGPAGARRVLRDSRVQAAVLETARGGLLRRGLSFTRANVGVITNISADHFGEYGVESIADLARAKAVVAHALSSTRGYLVLNAADHSLVSLPTTSDVRVVWFATADANEDGTSPDAEAIERVMAGVASHGYGALVRDGELRLAIAGVWHVVGQIEAFPITLAGAAAHNTANAATAAVAAASAGVPLRAISKTLQTFGERTDDNPGRLMVRSTGGVTVVMDYAHNPEGMTALCKTAAMLPAKRRLLLLGQAGNRDDAQLRALGEAAWSASRFDRVMIKEMHGMLRGRAAYEVPERLVEGLLSAGALPELIYRAPSEMDGVRAALEWARPGDLLVLGVHVDRARVVALIDALGHSDWRAGDDIPEALVSPLVE